MKIMDSAQLNNTDEFEDNSHKVRNETEVAGVGG